MTVIHWLPPTRNLAPEIGNPRIYNDVWRYSIGWGGNLLLDQSRQVGEYLWRGPVQNPGDTWWLWPTPMLTNQSVKLLSPLQKCPRLWIKDSWSVLIFWQTGAFSSLRKSLGVIFFSNAVSNCPHFFSIFSEYLFHYIYFISQEFLVFFSLNLAN